MIQVREAGAVAGLGMSCMSDEVLFLDTNVLVYVFDADEPDKQALAPQLLRDNPGNSTEQPSVVGILRDRDTQACAPLGARASLGGG